MKRLYLQIYLTVVACLVLVVVMAGAMWRYTFEAGSGAQWSEMAGEIAAALLPPATAPIDLQQQALARLSGRLGADLALFDAQRRAVAEVYGRHGAMRLHAPREAGMHFEAGAWRAGGWGVRLPDERLLVLRPTRAPWHTGVPWMFFLIAIAVLVAIAAHPIVRRMTRRLERLEAGVRALGEGNLAARVHVQGRDEIAHLARSFNQAAARIETLVAAHRLLLANASHELRTPLARIRMGIELQKGRPDAAREAELARDIAELDELIEEILLTSRLDATTGLETVEEIDLLALAAEECVRYEHCNLSGDSVLIHGDARLLRRLVRNLLENARKHGAPPIDVTVGGVPGGARLEVRDHGRGIPESERERIFAPFYRMAGSLGHVGSGLGLALVRQIARRHGGDASVLAVAGEGTDIRVTLALEPGARP